MLLGPSGPKSFQRSLVFLWRRSSAHASTGSDSSPDSTGSDPSPDSTGSDSSPNADAVAVASTWPVARL
jgi:hypothetical protein